MRLTIQKRLAAAVMKCSANRVWFDEDRLDDIKESITKQDIKSLIIEGVIREKPIKGTSRGKVRVNKQQKAKGLRKGHGSRKGKHTARIKKKISWINRIRIQRRFLKELRDKSLVTRSIYQMLYLRSKGGFFRSKRHIKLFIDEKKLAISKQNKK